MNRKYIPWMTRDISPVTVGCLHWLQLHKYRQWLCGATTTSLRPYYFNIWQPIGTPLSQRFMQIILHLFRTRLHEMQSCHMSWNKPQVSTTHNFISWLQASTSSDSTFAGHDFYDMLICICCLLENSCIPSIKQANLWLCHHNWV